MSRLLTFSGHVPHPSVHADRVSHRKKVYSSRSSMRCIYAARCERTYRHSTTRRCNSLCSRTVSLPHPAAARWLASSLAIIRCPSGHEIVGDTEARDTTAPFPSARLIPPAAARWLASSLAIIRCPSAHEIVGDGHETQGWRRARDTRVFSGSRTRASLTRASLASAPAAAGTPTAAASAPAATSSPAAAATTTSRC